MDSTSETYEPLSREIPDNAEVTSVRIPVNPANIRQDEHGDYVGTLQEINDIVATGATEQEVIADLASNLAEYAEEYLTDNFRLYFHSPNRRAHFPYVLKVAMQANQDAVVSLIHA